ncbi:MAG: hypothetical protein KC488_04270 [Candidatus Cloacimonetes bacterium]|nr:hypothetical protein [Candidatus Cloacimonadota bacterium]
MFRAEARRVPRDRGFAFLLLLLIVSGCALRSREHLEPAVEVYEDTLAAAAFQVLEQAQPANGAPSMDRPDGRYTLQPADEFRVSFPRIPEENFEGVVRPDGYITSPRYGDLMAMGLAGHELADSLGALYAKDYLGVHPTVTLTRTGSQYVYVYGAVKTPDRYEWDGSLDLLSALTMAGGPDTRGKLKSVIVVRVGYGGVYTYSVHDLQSMLSSTGTAPIWLQPRDIVIVPNRLISDIQQFISDYIMTWIPPVDAFIRMRYYWRLGNDVLQP